MGALRDVARLPDVRRIEFAWGLSLVGGSSSTVALLIYSYGQGGAALLALYSVGRAVSAAVATFLVSSLGDRVRRDHLLRLTTTMRVVLVFAAAALAMNGQGHGPLVISLAVVSAGCAGTFRPLQAGALPWLVRTPAELASANVAATMMENGGALLGPFVAGVMLLVASSGAALAMSAGWLALAAGALWRLRVPEESRHLGTGQAHVLRDARAGAASLVGVARPAGLVVLTFAQTFARGVLLVGLVVFSYDVLGLSDASIGWFNAAMGLGGLLGGFLGVYLIRATSLARSFVGGVALWGLPLLVVAVWPTVGIAYLAMLLIGLGNAFEDATMFTLLPRYVRAELAGRTLGALELLIVTGVGAGSVSAPWLLHTFGSRQTFGIIGVIILAVSSLYAARFAAVDRDLPRPGPELALMRRLPMFAPLPLMIVEGLAAQLKPHEFAAGEVVMRQGDPGNRFHIIERGTADVLVNGTAKVKVQPGECFGEIALLHDGPRTATIIARTALHTLALDRDAFLRAVTGNQVSASSASALAAQRLATDPSAQP